MVRVEEGQRPLQIRKDSIRPGASPAELRKKLLDIFSKEGPLNTCQVCRRVQGVHKDDINYCRIVKSLDYGASRWTGRGHEPYPLCQEHNPPHSYVYRTLMAMVKRNRIETARVRLKDPQKKGRAWDIMRVWGLDLDRVLRQTMPYYLGRKRQARLNGSKRKSRSR